MGLFTRKKKGAIQEKNLGLSSVDDRGWTRIFDWAPGAWQQHSRYDTSDSVLSNPTVFSCLTLISSDIGKLIPTTERQDANGIWNAYNSPVSDVLRRPNGYQNYIQFKQSWMYSKLVHGNTYVLKVREGRDVVGMHILDPLKVLPLVSDSGEVFYQLESDDLPDLPGLVIVPATEVIHDRCHALFHPLIGLSPIYACAVAAEQGLAIQKDGKAFFQRGAKPAGLLSAPGPISDEVAQRLKEYWQDNFAGDKAGSIAVLGDDLRYEAMRMSSVDAQLIEQLGWTAEMICACYHVPPYKVGVGTMPTHDNIEALTQDYYSQCLQIHIEDMEVAIHQGLAMPNNTRIQLDLNGLFRMDSERKTRTLGEGVKGSILAPNEARKQMNLSPLEGGDSVYLQQQNYSLEALAKRDAGDPLSVQTPEPAPMPEPTDEEMADEARLLAYLVHKELNIEYQSA
jgi:HK97 family phage portal protein